MATKGLDLPCGDSMWRVYYPLGYPVEFMNGDKTSWMCILLGSFMLCRSWSKTDKICCELKFNKVFLYYPVILY